MCRDRPKRNQRQHGGGDAQRDHDVKRSITHGSSSFGTVAREVAIKSAIVAQHDHIKLYPIRAVAFDVPQCRFALLGRIKQV
jgi:hypothetical protein